MRFLFIILLFSLSITAKAITYNSTSGGDWMTPGRWNPSGPPTEGSDAANLNTIIIQAGHTITISGEDIDLAHVVIHVYGTLNMSNQFFLSTDYANLNLTGANSGLVLHNGGSITEGVLVPGSLNIRVNGNVVWNGNDGNVSNSSGSPIYYPIGLPIELILWNIEASGSMLEAQWTTTSEKNNDFFTIELSEDGSSFEPVGEVKSKGNTNTNKEYHYTFETSRIGQVYFRLKQTDFDGKFTYSEIISKLIVSTTVEEISIFPNPITNNTFSIHTLGGTINQVTLLNFQSGKELFHQDFSLVNSNYVFIELPPNLPKGLYLLKVEINNKIETETIIIY